MYIEDDFIDGMDKEVTDPVDDASKHDIEKVAIFANFSTFIFIFSFLTTVGKTA